MRLRHSVHIHSDFLLVHSILLFVWLGSWPGFTPVRNFHSGVKLECPRVISFVNYSIKTNTTLQFPSRRLLVHSILLFVWLGGSWPGVTPVRNFHSGVRLECPRVIYFVNYSIKLQHRQNMVVSLQIALSDGAIAEPKGNLHSIIQWNESVAKRLWRYYSSICSSAADFKGQCGNWKEFFFISKNNFRLYDGLAVRVVRLENFVDRLAGIGAIFSESLAICDVVRKT